MNMTHPKIILNSFTSALANTRGSQNSLVIHKSDFAVLNLERSNTKVNGFRWLDSVPTDTQYDFILADLPFQPEREDIQIGNEKIKIRKNWCELIKALRLLQSNGICLALIEPPAFGIGDGPKYL